MSMVLVLLDESGVPHTRRLARLGRPGITSVTCPKMPLGRTDRPRQRRSLA